MRAIACLANKLPVIPSCASTVEHESTERQESGPESNLAARVIMLLVAAETGKAQFAVLLEHKRGSG
jgi:hypothetical protein